MRSQGEVVVATVPSHPPAHAQRRTSSSVCEGVGGRRRWGGAYGSRSKRASRARLTAQSRPHSPALLHGSRRDDGDVAARVCVRPRGVLTGAGGAAQTERRRARRRALGRLVVSRRRARLADPASAHVAGCGLAGGSAALCGRPLARSVSFALVFVLFLVCNFMFPWWCGCVHIAVVVRL